MFGGEGLGEYFPMSALKSIVPKESERELVLAEEQQALEEEEASENKKNDMKKNASTLSISLQQNVLVLP